MLEVSTGEGGRLRSGNVTSLVTAWIALDDGQEVRVLAGVGTPEAGQTVTLIESRYSHGGARYRLEQPRQ